MHSALALLCTRSWSLTQLTLFRGISFEFVSDSDPSDCVSIWNSRKFPRISVTNANYDGGYNISALFALEMEEIWNFHVEISFLLFVLHFESNFSIRREGISMKFRKKKKKKIFFVNIWISVRTIDCDVKRIFACFENFFRENFTVFNFMEFWLSGLLSENFREISFNFACLVIFYYNRVCMSS